MNEQEQKISRYLSDEMPKEELRAFESELANNSILAEEVKDYRETYKEINNIKLKNKLIGVSQRFAQKENKKKKQKSIYNYIGIAASLILILTFTYLFFFNSQLAPEKLYVKHFKPFPVYGTTVRGNNDELNEALDLYTSKKYKEALSILKTVQVDNSNKVKTQFFKAMCYMTLNQHENAINILEELPKTNMLIQQINWYLGLAYLKENNKEWAKVNFLLIKEGEYQFEEAQKILEGLE